MIVWQTDKQLKRVLLGKKVELLCSACSRKTKFYESEIEENFKVYFVVELWKRTKRVLQCGDCLAVCDYYEIFPDEKMAEEKAEAERKLKAAEAEAKKKQHEVEQEQKRRQAQQEQAEREMKEELLRREKERDRKAAEVNDELAKLKKQMGKD